MKKGQNVNKTKKKCEKRSRIGHNWELTILDLFRTICYSFYNHIYNAKWLKMSRKKGHVDTILTIQNCWFTLFSKFPGKLNDSNESLMDPWCLRVCTSHWNWIRDSMNYSFLSASSATLACILLFIVLNFYQPP